MTRQSTVRLPVAVSLVLGGMVAAMVGRPEAALFVVPWVVLLVLGFSSLGRGVVQAKIEVGADRVMIGDDVPVEVTVRSDADGWIEMRPAQPADSPTATSGSAWSTAGAALGQVLRADRPVSVSFRLPAHEWGTHEVGRFEVRFHESYGLFEWRGVVSDVRPVRVHPSPVDLQKLLTPWLVRRQSGVHPSTDRTRGVEFADIRPFGSGDGLRDINWRASARSDRLLVSERHPERSTDVVLMIDSFDESGLDLGMVMGAAVEAAIALAESHLSLTDRVGLVDLGGVPRWVVPGTGQQQLQRLVDALLATRLFVTAADRGVGAIPVSGLPPRSFILALTPMLDQRFVASLFALRAAGHDVAVIEVELSVVDERRYRSDMADLAIQWFEAEQAVTRDRLAAQGVIVGRWRHGDHLDAALADTLTRRTVVGARR